MKEDKKLYNLYKNQELLALKIENRKLELKILKLEEEIKDKKN